VAQQNDKTTVFFMLTVMAFAIVLVDDRWVRVGLGLLPALLLAERALMGSGVGEEPRIGAADRRDDGAVRGYIDDLLKHFREFYTTCHLMAGGQLEPEEAKDLAAGIERRLNALLAEITDAARERDSA
jgi:hypothetical protein